MKCPACRSENPGDSRYCHKCGSALGEGPSQTLSYSPDQAAAASEALKFSPGERFGGRYTIIEEIGRGGMGRVYKAEDHELGITVVLKMIRPELAARPHMVELFRRETLLGRSISHENVVRIHDLGVVGDVKYISMDFIKGENLSELIQTSGSLTLAACLKIALQICQALKAAHQKGIVHQDLKPQNVMIDNSGRVFVMDFGLAESLMATKTVKSGRIRGTPRYFSPEQARGEEPDGRSDIYSFGIMLYEMVTGAAPFNADTLDGYIREHTSVKPAPPSKVNPTLPPGCERIILKCLEKRKEDRYQTVDELLRDLEFQRKQERVFGAGTRIKRWPAALLAAALTVGAGAAAYWLFVRPPKAHAARTSIAVMYAVNNSGDKSLDDQLRWQIPYYLYMDLAQSKYLTVLPQDRLMQVLQDMKQLDEEHHLSKTLDRVADSANVAYFVLPVFTKVADSFLISFTVRKAKSDESLGEPVTVRGKSIGDLFAMVEEMSLKVKSRLNLSPKEISGDFNPNLGQITTTSPEALRFYIEGNKLYIKGDFAASLKSFADAVREDPNFAMAYLKMAIDFNYLDDYAQHRTYLQKALGLVDRASERDRYLIQAYAYSALDESPLKAMESYQKLIDLNPQDEEAQKGVGVIRRYLEEWDAALERFDEILALDPKNAIALENKVFIYTAKGWYEKALELCGASIKMYPDMGFFIMERPLLHLIQGRYDFASAELEKAQGKTPGEIEILELTGNLRHLMGDFAAARRIYEQLQRNGEAIPDAPNYRGRLWSARLLLEQGRYREAREVLLQGIALSQGSHRVYDEVDARLSLAYIELQTREFSQAADALKPVLQESQKDSRMPSLRAVLHLDGLASLGMGRIEEAKKIAQELRRNTETAGFTKGLRRYEHLMGYIALAESRTSEAVRYFEAAAGRLPEQQGAADEQAFYFDGLAAARFRSGDWSKAAETYRAIISLTTGRLEWGDIYARSYYWLGKISQKTGDGAGAAAHYRRFLELWKDADSGLTEVADAQNQLAALRKSP